MPRLESLEAWLHVCGWLMFDENFAPAFSRPERFGREVRLHSLIKFLVLAATCSCLIHSLLIFRFLIEVAMSGAGLIQVAASRGISREMTGYRDLTGVLI